MSENQKDPSRKVYSAEAKYKIIKEALTTDQGVTEICRKYGIAVSLFYKWQEQFFSGAKSALENGPAKGLSTAEHRELTELKNENSKMKDVIAEITAENIGFKKKNLV